MFNLSQLYSIPHFQRASYYEVSYNERAFITMNETKRDPQFLDNVSCRVLAEIYEHPQRNFDQLLVFASTRFIKFHLFV